MSSEPEAQPRNPYAAPTEDDEQERVPRVLVEAAGYRDQSQLLSLLLVSLALQAMAYAVNGAACSLLLLAELSDAFQQQLVEVTEAVSQASVAVYLLGVFPFAMFLVRANKNARSFVNSSEDSPASVLRFSPASMVWWFAVPIFSLFRPYQAVRAVWESSMPDADSAFGVTREPVLRWWWGAWLVDLLWDRFASAWSRLGIEPETQNITVLVGALLGIANCWLALAMLRSLHGRQQQRAAELWRG